MSNILNLEQMLAMVRYKLAEPTNSLSTWDATTGDPFIKQMINQANYEFNAVAPLPWMETTYDFTTVQTTVSSSSTGTTLNVTSANGFGIGEYGWVFEGSNYERFLITNVATGVLTLSGSGLSSTYTTAAKVVRESYNLPDDFNLLFSVRDVTNKRFIKPRNPHKYDYDVPKYNASGKPQNYLLWGLDLAREPAGTGTYTADTSTSTTQIKDAALTAKSEDFYKFWLAVNTTAAHNDQARVTAYDATNKILTLSRALTGQVSGDTYYLQKFLRQILFSTLSDSAYTIRIRYFRNPSLLVNDYDVPETPAMFHMAIVHGAMAYMLMQDGNEQRGMFYKNLMEQERQKAWMIYGAKRYGLDDVYAIQNTGRSDYAKSDDSDD